MPFLSFRQPVRVALLDLYKGEPNLGMDALRQFLTAYESPRGTTHLAVDTFDVRAEGEVPGLDYDIYLSSGGPGSPFDGEGQAWETDYFRWLEQLWEHNARPDAPKKHALFICHSFQMMCRFFELGNVTKRRSKSFGVYATHPTAAGLRDPLFAGLEDPFYAADFRNWQVVHPDEARLADLGAEILAWEKERAHVPLPRAVMAIRLSPELVGVQLHPEAAPDGMLKHFQRPDPREKVMDEHGAEKYARFIRRLKDPDYLAATHTRVLPNFLGGALAALRTELAAA